jgi:uncharacterized SAM-dependent methyltransferase
MEIAPEYNAPTVGSTPFHPVSTLTLLREQEIVVQLRKAFAERYLPEHLFYWLPSSVQAWVDLCRSTEYKNASRAIEVLKASADDIARRSGDVRTLCGLGCGEGSKDRILLDAFAQRGKPWNFIACDFSQALLELAVDQALAVTASGLAVKLDVFNDDHLQLMARQARNIGTPVLFSVLGNTLGAFDPKRFPARLKEMCNPEDRFVFDGEIFNPATLAGYDNPTNRRFAWGPLTGVGIGEDDGRIEFSTDSLADGLFAVKKHFIASRDIRVHVGGEWIEIRSGETLNMSSSIKYRNDSTLVGMVEAGGFKVETNWMSKDGHFVLGYAKPR